MAGTIIPGSIIEVEEGHIWLTSEADEELKNGKGDEDDMAAMHPPDPEPDGVATWDELAEAYSEGVSMA